MGITGNKGITGLKGVTGAKGVFGSWGGVSIIDPTNYTHVTAGAADIDTVDLGGGDVAFGSVGGLIVTGKRRL